MPGKIRPCYPAPFARAAGALTDAHRQEPRIAQAGERLEALFAEQLLKAMRRTASAFAPAEGLAAATARDGLDGHLDTMLADHLASRQGLGVAAFIMPLLHARRAVAPSEAAADVGSAGEHAACGVWRA